MRLGPVVVGAVLAGAVATVVTACRAPAPPQARDADASVATSVPSRAESPAPAVPIASSGGEPDATFERALPDARSAWCAGVPAGWHGLDETTCYFVPAAGLRSPARLLVYLPGIIPPTPDAPQKENVLRVVAAAASSAGAAALLPRGRRGIGPADAKDWWAWPTVAADYAAHRVALVAEWSAARATLEAALGHPFERVYLAGSSSGAYFLGALALNGAVDFDGYAAASGGAVGSGLAFGAHPRPFYVGWGAGDPTKGGPKALAAFLSASSWPVRAAEHPGGHGARQVYLDEAFAFWESADARASAGR